MTTEEKARAYEAALERAKYYQKENGSAVISAIFPELSESDDEKVRKALVKYFTLSDEHAYNEACGVSYKDIVAWLEKQKELTSDEEKQGKEDVLWCINQAKKYAKDENEMGTCWFAEKWLEKQGDSATPQVYETKNGEVITYSESEGYKVVEPKFKVGDWIVENGVNRNPIQITSFEEDKGVGIKVWFNNGTGTYVDFLKGYHKWTIQDAKDGDVLFQDLMGGYTFIYNGVNPNMAMLYSFIISNDGEDVLPYHIGKPNTGIGNIEENKNIIYPATKEQRDFLFQKMKEAGYEWSNKDRKLIKTEEQSEQGAINDTNEEVSEELKAASILHSELVRNQSCIDEDFIAGAQWLKRQNCAWSEEDEEMFNNIIEDDLMPYGEQDKIDWLNLLKERIN